MSTNITPQTPLALTGVEIYLVFATRSFLLLLYEVGGGGWRRSGPHAADDSNAVLWERREAQLLALPHLDALQLLEAAKGELRQGTRFHTSTSATSPPSPAGGRVSPECSSTAAVAPSSWGSEGRVRCRTW